MQVLERWSCSNALGKPDNPVRTALWSPSALAVAVVVGSTRDICCPSQVLVFTASLEPLLDQRGVEGVAWAPCSAVLACLSKDKLSSIELPMRASSDASRAHLELIASLQADTAGLDVKQLIWGRNTCVCKVLNAAQEQSLLVRHAQSTMPFWLPQSGMLYDGALAVSPSGRRTVLAAAGAARTGLWLLEVQSGGQVQARCVRTDPMSPDAMAWHPTELYFGVLTPYAVSICSILGVMGQVITFEQVRIGDRLTCQDMTLSFSCDGAQLVASVSKTKVALVTFGSASSCSPAQVQAAAQTAARPFSWAWETSCACFGVCLMVCVQTLVFLSCLFSPVALLVGMIMAFGGK